ncbi:hypothetical protein [Pseudomonas putida]|uniref:hypothetical protein n=1 Tax=Pseudomonas putida TaxID=303 RepID=UPI00244B51B5|nr:hypothetical protein [Pseudomonas putida]MDG9815812.1 hypothetical protein [Pseudomonas putida]
MSAPNRKSAAQLKTQCDAWNNSVPVGALIAFENIRDKGVTHTGKTTSEAQVMGGHSAVVWFEGKSGAVSLDHCTVIATEPSAEKADYNDVFPGVYRGASWERRAQTMIASISDRLPVFGQFLLTGPGPAGLLEKIGYVVQIRRRQGIFGSDVYLLRHCDGSLCQHSNNMFQPLTPDEAIAVLPCFGNVLPPAEGQNPTYGLGEPDTRVQGFIIEPPEGFQPRGGEGARMRMTVTDADGNQQVTDTVFL